MQSRIIFWWLIILSAMLSSGCVSDQRSEFRGTITRTTTATNAPSINPIGLDFQCLNPKFADALTGFGISQGDILFVHDRQKYVNHDYRLSNDAVPAVYFYKLEIPINEKMFLGESVTARDKTEGLQRLQGSFDAEK